MSNVLDITVILDVSIGQVANCPNVVAECKA